MNDELLYKLGLKQKESEKIHNELFKTTTEYQYYLYGIAQGLCSVCDMLNRIDGENEVEFDINNIRKFVNSIAVQEDDVNKYFQRLMKDINRK